jgi:thiamine biosynthesis lipoprotein
MMNRRDFLSSRRLANAAGQVLGAVDDLAELADIPEEEQHAAAAETVLIRASRRAMATTFEVALPFATPNALAASDAVCGLIDQSEAQLTVYRDESEVNSLNRQAASQRVCVEKELFNLLRLAARITTDTQGAFDVSAGAIVKAWGFFRGPRRVPSTEERTAALQCSGMRHVILDPQDRSVQFLRPGLEINLGSIGKGDALDRAVRLLRQEWNVRTGLLHAGHSSVYAMGKEPTTGQGWRIALRHPWIAGQRMGMVSLSDRALGTSAATFQHLEHYGRKLGHILDPRTAWPAEGIASASVTAPTAAEADALATAFFILGLEGARAYCAHRPEIGAIMLADGDKAAPVVLGTALSEFTPSLPPRPPAQKDLTL